MIIGSMDVDKEINDARRRLSHFIYGNDIRAGDYVCVEEWINSTNQSFMDSVLLVVSVDADMVIVREIEPYNMKMVFILNTKLVVLRRLREDFVDCWMDMMVPH